MTDEQLIFHAGAAADEARTLCGELWKLPPVQDAAGAADLRTRMAALRAAATRLHCAATELDNRAAGTRPPKTG